MGKQKFSDKFEHLSFSTSHEGKLNENLIFKGHIAFGTTTGWVYLLTFSQKKGDKICNSGVWKKNLDLPISKVQFFRYEKNINLICGTALGYLVLYQNIEINNLSNNKGKLSKTK